MHADHQQVLICLPERSNGHLIVFAHGYVRPQRPLELPGRDLEIDQIRRTIEQLNELGFTFATMSYHKNGYAVEQGEQDVADLVEHITALEDDITRVWLVGASEGGLVTAALVERRPSPVDGGLALCAPLAGPLSQIRYLTDVRLVFDYLFPELFPFGVADTPSTAWQDWKGESGYRERIGVAIEADPDATDELIDVTRMRCALEPRSECVEPILAYSLFGLHDLITTAGGWPYDNRNTVYRGSSDDAALNAGIERLSGDWSARQYLHQHYRPGGQLRRYLVTMHTTDDELVPFWHERTYEGRVKAAGRTGRLTQIELDRAGHCSFEADEIVGALALLILREDGDLPADMVEYLGRLVSVDDLSDQGREELRSLIGEIDGTILDAVDATVDGAKDVIDEGSDVVDDAKDKVEDQVKKLF